MPELFPITTADKLACARRELDKRREVYPRLIEAGKLDQAKADREIETMSAIVDDYARFAAFDTTEVSASLLRVMHRADGKSGARLRIDVAVKIPGQEQARITPVDILTNAYGLRCTWLETGRLMEQLRAAGVTSFLPDASQAFAAAEAEAA